MAADELLVVLYDLEVGRMRRRSMVAGPEFTYEPGYVESGSTPLSVRMPLGYAPFRGTSVRAYLEGLLPEDRNTRADWGARLGVDPDDVLSVLARMGWDCPGAVQFCEPDTLDDMRSRSESIIPADDAHIAARLRSLRTGSEPTWTLPEEHWSLAGQQSKIALRWREGDGWHEAHGSAATTHIIKPGIGRLAHQALVEHVTMQAARTLGVDVARSEFTHFEDEPAIVIERYDRRWMSSDSVQRVHQEDFCSASGRLPARKYEEHGGPTLADMVRIAEQHVDDRDAAVRALGDFVAFNYVAGAPDGHSKNVSLLLLPGRTKVAPLYDLASALPYSSSGRSMQSVAIHIGGRRRFGEVLGKHWDRAAGTLGIPPVEFRARARELAEGFTDAYSDALTQVGSDAAAAIRERSMDRIASHVKRVIDRLGDPTTA